MSFFPEAPTHGMPEAVAARIPPVLPERHITRGDFGGRFVDEAEGLRDAINLGDRESIIGKLADREILRTDFMRGRVSPQNLLGIVSSLDKYRREDGEFKFGVGGVGEVATNAAIDFAIAVKSNDRRGVILGLVNEMETDRLVRQRFGISDVEVAERVGAVKAVKAEKAALAEAEEAARKEILRAELMEIVREDAVRMKEFLTH